MLNKIRVKNKAEILRVPKTYKKRREILLKILEKVFEQISAEKLTQKALSKTKLPPYKHLYILGVGKASYGMVKAANAVLKDKISGGIIIVPKGSKVKQIPKINTLFASHPIPCNEGKKSAEKLLNFARKMKKDDLVLFFLSGGGSAMLPLPTKGICLEDKVEITKLLLKRGATINEINTVRKHISQIKGGQLAKALYGAKTICLVFSDVVGSDPSVIASGPLSPDNTKIKDAMAIIKKYKIPGKFRHSDFTETVPKEDKCFKNIAYKIIGDHKTVLDVAAGIAEKLDIHVKKYSSTLTGDAAKTGKKLVNEAKKGLLVATGETTVNVKGDGEGGRNQELSLSALQSLKENQTILSVGTDGVDGITPVKIAGAIADGYTRKKYKNLNIHKYLKQNDSYNFFLHAKSLIKTGSTGQNLGDLIMVLTD